MNLPRDLDGDAAAPRAAQVLGLGGLLPFIGGAGLAIAGAAPGTAFWLQVLVTYAAVIASFVGALQWAYAVRSGAGGAPAWLRYGWSVVPALLAWGTLMLPPASALPLQAALLTACYAADRWLAPSDPGPAWMMRLRLVLTVVATLALLAAASLAIRPS